ncbi:helix-turn-helix transcriptional regulator [Nocardioides sp. TF02-7]|uniref:helix-turn-helix domain-containing protein n=1 Tax=Nocardioides sp. TF02-7 TaxID=2917724 RepID=UPI001F053FFA|nr:helix-turn-helix transcriptional regulator [Nocardioides sp. TF02-7]UMG91393.1 helix-turn-helix domain-containing protein [Nocardioides sp. TF02-7]
MAPLASSPWGPDGERLVSLAGAAHLRLVERALVECRRVYRQREEARERSAIAREIRRMIAVSGLSQREFSAYVGTSPSRLSTYVTGKVTPSATMMLRIKGAARMLAQEAQEQSQQAHVVRSAPVTGRSA